MINTICLNKNFSTTKLLIEEKPTLENRPEDKFETVLFLPRDENRKGEGGLRTKGYFKKSYDEKPLVTIITVVYNGEAYLEETIQSVLQQSYDNVDYIIIDGGSTDRTIDIIKTYEDQVDYWISEKDYGIYDAMNKGLTLAMGTFIAFLNADDWYDRHSVRHSIHTLKQTNSDYSIGNIQKLPSKILVKPIIPLKPNLVYQEMMYPHPSAFIKLNVYKKVGLFDVRYKIAADYEMALRIHLQGFQATYTKHTIAFFREGGISAGKRSIKERLHVVLDYDKNYILAYTTYSTDILKFYLKKIIPKSILKVYQYVKKSRFQYESKD